MGDGLRRGSRRAVVGGKGHVVGVDGGGDGDLFISGHVGDHVRVSIVFHAVGFQIDAVHGDGGSRLCVAFLQCYGEGGVGAVADGLRFGSSGTVVGGEGHVVAVQRGADGHGLVGSHVFNDVGEGEIVLGGTGERFAAHGDHGSGLGVAGFQRYGEGAVLAVVDRLRCGSVRAVVGGKGHVVAVDGGGDGDGLIGGDAGDLVAVYAVFIAKGFQRLAVHGDGRGGLGVAGLQGDGELAVRVVVDGLRGGDLRAVVGGEGHVVAVQRGVDHDRFGLLDGLDHVVIRTVHHTGSGERFVVHRDRGSGLRVAGLGRHAEAAVLTVVNRRIGGGVRAVVGGKGDVVGVLGGGDADVHVRGHVFDLIGIGVAVLRFYGKRCSVHCDGGGVLRVTIGKRYGKAERAAVGRGGDAVADREALVALNGKGVVI